MGKLTRREREKLAKRDDILEAALEVFAEKGFAAATLDEIAEKAEFSKAALYLYFKNKEDLFLSLIDTRLQELRSAITENAAKKDDPVEKLRTAVASHFVFQDRHQIFFQLFSRVKSDLGPDNFNSTMKSEVKRQLQMSHQAYIDCMAGILQEGIQRGCYHYDDKMFLAHMLSGFIIAVMCTCGIARATPGGQDFTLYYEHALDIFLHGAAKK
jgi:TetR/AcrR family transcriptional regulator